MDRASASASAVLEDVEVRRSVRARQEFWLDNGIQSAPSMVFEQEFFTSGAQGVTVFFEVLAKFNT